MVQKDHLFSPSLFFFFKLSWFWALPSQWLLRDDLQPQWVIGTELNGTQEVLGAPQPECLRTGQRRQDRSSHLEKPSTRCAGIRAACGQDLAQLLGGNGWVLQVLPLLVSLHSCLLSVGVATRLWIQLQGYSHRSVTDISHFQCCTLFAYSPSVARRLSIFLYLFRLVTLSCLLFIFWMVCCYVPDTKVMDGFCPACLFGYCLY